MLTQVELPGRNWYAPTVPDRKIFCSEFRALMLRLLCVRQTLVRSRDFACSFSVFGAFMRLSWLDKILCVYVHTFVRSPDYVFSCSDFRAFTILSWIDKILCIYVQTFVRSCSDFCVFTRLSCVHETFVTGQDFVRLCSDFRAFKVRQTAITHNVFT